MVEFINGDILTTMYNVFIINTIIIKLFELFSIPVIITSILSLYYFSDKIYILFNRKTVIFKYYDLHYEITFNKTLYFKHKCSCCDECNGEFKFYGKIKGYHELINDESYIMGVNNCINNYDYVCEGLYDDKKQCFYNCDVLFSSGTTYKGGYSFGMSNGYGVISIRKKVYDKRDTIRVIKEYGFWKNGRLDKTKQYEVKLIFDNCYFAKIAIYKNFEVVDDSLRCYIFYRKNKKVVNIYNGQIRSNYHKHGIGELKFKDGCARSFYGIFCCDNPIWGRITYCNDITYVGFIDNNFNYNGEGVIDKTNYNSSSTCSIGLKYFKFHNATKRIRGYFEKGVLRKYIKSSHNEKCEVKKLKCDQPINAYCINCRKLLCISCGIHCCDKKHIIIRNNIIEKTKNIYYKNIDILRAKINNDISEKELANLEAKLLKIQEKNKVLEVKLLKKNSAIKIQRYFRIFLKNRNEKFRKAVVIIERNYLRIKYNVKLFYQNLHSILKGANHKNITFSKKTGKIKYTKYNGYISQKVV